MIGFSTFRLEFHLAYLTLNDGKSSDIPWPYIGGSGECGSGPDTTRSSGKLDGCPEIVHEAHTTVIIVGHNHFNWYGSAFGHTGLPDNPDDIKDQSSEMDESLDFGVNDFWREEEEDFFATGGCEPLSADNKRPICDPRTYFLQATQYRLSVVVQAYEHLIHELDNGLKTWVSSHCYLCVVRPNKIRCPMLSIRSMKHHICRARFA